MERNIVTALTSEKKNTEKKDEQPLNNSNVQPKEQCQAGYTTGEMMIHNIPLLIMYALGIILISFLNFWFGIIFIFYFIVSNYIFMLKICSYCPHYGSRSSLCGYGLLTKYITTKKKIKGFKVQFKRYIAVLFPEWFLPLIVGIFLLIRSFDWLILVLLIVFIIIAFGVVLYVSKSKSCDTCKLKGACPWSSICGN